MTAATDSPSASNTYFDQAFACASSIDPSVTGLAYWITYDLGVAAALPAAVPVALLEKGYTGTKDSFLDVDRQRAASAGFFVLTPGGRGNNGATGSRDANARSPQDLADVIADARRRFPAIASATVCVAYGAYSGGGGDVAALILKRPGIISAAALYFPLLDYSSWYAYNAVQSVALLDVDIGGSPTTWPLRYLARYFGKWLPLALSLLGSRAPRLWSFWDIADNILDASTQRDFVAACAAVGVTITYVESTSGAIAHGYPQGAAGVIAREADYAATMRATTAITMPTAGSLPILGWIAWGSLSVWIGSSATPRASDGGDRVGLLAFDTVARVYRISPLTGPMYVSLRDGATTIAFLCSRPCVVDVSAGTVTEINDGPAGPLLLAIAPLAGASAPLLGTSPPVAAPIDPRPQTRIL